VCAARPLFVRIRHLLTCSSAHVFDRLQGRRRCLAVYKARLFLFRLHHSNHPYFLMSVPPSTSAAAPVIPDDSVLLNLPTRQEGRLLNFSCRFADLQRDKAILLAAADVSTRRAAVGNCMRSLVRPLFYLAFRWLLEAFYRSRSSTF
jgi:hypothetical protein